MRLHQDRLSVPDSGGKSPSTRMRRRGYCCPGSVPPVVDRSLKFLLAYCVRGGQGRCGLLRRCRASVVMDSNPRWIEKPRRARSQRRDLQSSFVSHTAYLDSQNTQMTCCVRGGDSTRARAKVLQDCYSWLMTSRSNTVPSSPAFSELHGLGQ